VGEFIPIIHKTQTTKAKIIKVSSYNWGKGVRKYIVRYEFTFEGEEYYGKYDMWSNSEKEGDSVLVKFATSNPELNEVQ